MTLTAEQFAQFHEAVHGRPPFPWQTRLLQKVAKDRRWPAVLDLPTSSGKTTCIDIALFALALDAEGGKTAWCPRRIAMVVDRRVVVDQAAERGRKLLRALAAAGAAPVVHEVADRLRALCPDEAEPVGVFTLRGGIPKDDGWARSPEQPLILASTVDQLGSRLLVQGYGVSQGMKPVHAGLLGNDTLLLLDEVHLSQALAQTLEQLAKLRGRFASQSPVRPRFHFAFLSATPGTGASSEAPFLLDEADRAPTSALAPRLAVSKRAEIEEVEGRPALVAACVKRGADFAAKHGVTAVVVNRVASAVEIARGLRERANEAFDVVLLTGRMRPLERDDVLDGLRPRIMAGRDREAGARKLVVVATQCVEAGADFDFDALVTESASLDALRQRFGRVDRLGDYRKAEGAIVHDKAKPPKTEGKDGEPKGDPIYGKAIAKTVAWLKKKATRRDFRAVPLAAPSAEELPELLAPRPDAPVLMPAYLDLWMQTAPAPTVLPDVALWLHGPESGPADVQVVWRADVDEEDLAAALRDDGARERLTAVVGAVSPSSLEAMSLPFVTAKRWLMGEDALEGLADVERTPSDERDRGNRGRPAFRWAGDESAVADASNLRPGATIVVPASRGGIRAGNFDPRCTDAVADQAERASVFGRALPVLRLHPAVLAGLGLDLAADDAAEARQALRGVTPEGRPAWWRPWLDGLRSGGHDFVVDGERPTLVLRGRRLPAPQVRAMLAAGMPAEDGGELTTDEEDSVHAGRAITLARHCADVERLARRFAESAGLPEALVEDVALAGWLHDVGKADPRFQRMLRGGSEIDWLKDPTPLAKSAMPREARSAHRRAQARAGYPRGERHEVQSAAMLQSAPDAVTTRAHDPELVLYLVASHHGHCRPFAPVPKNAPPVDVSLVAHASARFGAADFGPVSSSNGLHRLDSPLADRFWGLVEKYGWLELCWLETILRLADHRASEAEAGGAP